MRRENCGKQSDLFRIFLKDFSAALRSSDDVTHSSAENVNVPFCLLWRRFPIILYKMF